MAYVSVEDIPASWPHYEELVGTLDDHVPEGLIVRVAGPTEEGVRIIEVWECEAAFRSFYETQLRPLFERLHTSYEPLVRDLHARHITRAASPRDSTNPDRQENRP